MQVSPKTAAAVLAAAVAVGVLLPLPGTHPAAVHALAVPAAQLAGPCEGMPQLDAETLGWLFAPALVPDGSGVEKSPVVLYINNDRQFSIVPGKPADKDYTVTLTDDGGATVVGSDPASAALLARHMNICLGAVEVTPSDGPGIWTDGGTYVPMGQTITADR